MTLALGPAGEGDLDYAEAVLAANDLPTADLRSDGVRLFVAEDGPDRVGVGGLELHGSDALLRSVAVEEEARGEGYGTAICARLEGHAREEGVEALYLLTTTAAEFFEGLGFERIDRDDAPAAIRGTTEFAELCPDSAIPMRKDV